jgi:hypothetical protein
MGQERHAAVLIQRSHEGPQSRHLARHLPCPIGMAIRPCLPRWRILDAHSMGRQVGLDRLNANHMHVRPDVEDLRR